MPYEFQQNRRARGRPLSDSGAAESMRIFFLTYPGLESSERCSPTPILIQNSPRLGIDYFESGKHGTSSTSHSLDPSYEKQGSKLFRDGLTQDPTNCTARTILSHRIREFQHLVLSPRTIGKACTAKLYLGSTMYRQSSWTLHDYFNVVYQVSFRVHV